MNSSQQVRNRRSPSPAVPRVRGLILLAGLVGLGLLPPAPPPAQAGVVSGPPLVEPFALRSKNGLLDATLVEKPDVTVVGGTPVSDVWTYHVGEDGPPNYAGPTLYVRPGDT